MTPPNVSIATESYGASDAYLEALNELLSPALPNWSITIEIDIPPFATWDRVLRACGTCQDLGIGFHLDDLCMMADHVDFERRWPDASELDRLLDRCPDTFLGVRLHAGSETHEVTPNHYLQFLKWNAAHRRELQVVVEASEWPGSDWERTTTVHPEQPWTVLAHVHPTVVGPTVGSPQLRRLPPGAKEGRSFHLDHPLPCSPQTLEQCLAGCLPGRPACLAFRPLGWLVDNPGSAKLPEDLHRWPLFNMVDALRPRGRLVLTECGEMLARMLNESPPLPLTLDTNA